MASAPGGGSGRGGGPHDPTLDRRSRTCIGQGLRAMYDDLVREELPEDWLALLNRARGPEPTP